MDDESEVIARKPVCDELCRLCANTDKQLIPIFQGEGVEHNLSDQIKKYLPIIKVTEIDKLPLQVCYQCTSTLIAWHNFFEQCRVADSRLREILPSSEKFNQDDDPYHDYTDDFRDDSESQSPVIEKKDEASVTVSIIDSSQRMETNDIVSSIKSKEDDKSESETLCENRCCLQATNTSTHMEAVCANMLGTRSGCPLSSSHHSTSALCQRPVNDAVVTPTDDNKENKCPFSICSCIWSNDNDCSKCLPFNKFACGYCPMVFLQAHFRNRHLRESHQKHLLDYCLNWLYENSLKSDEDVATNTECVCEDVSLETVELPRFQCNECAIIFFDKSILIKHLRNHEKLRRSAGNRKILKCEHCNIGVTTKVALIAHLLSAHDDIFENKSVVPSLRSSNTSGQTPAKTDYYTCDICGHIFLKLYSFSRHLNAHSSKRFTCSTCKKSFSNEQVLANHEARKHGEQPKNVLVLNGRKYLKCDQCPFTCRNERNKLEEHLRVHTGEKPFTCELCGKQFRTRSLLRVHRRFVHDGVKQYPCDVCGRCFSNRRYAEEHRRIHTGEKPLICDLCGKTFRQGSSLTKHLEHHMGIKRHACHLCNKRFSNTHHLKIHIKRHLGVATHFCAQCGKGFVDQYQLKNHHVVHSEARPFVCVECGAGFKLRKHLKQHGRTHGFIC